MDLVAAYCWFGFGDFYFFIVLLYCFCVEWLAVPGTAVTFRSYICDVEFLRFLLIIIFSHYAND